MTTLEDNCILLKNRINTITEWHNKYINALKIVNEEHPEFINQPLDITSIADRLGTVPNNIEQIKNYLKSANEIYLKAMAVYETLKDDHSDYFNEKKFLYT